jgi:hypothetical protein
MRLRCLSVALTLGRIGLCLLVGCVTTGAPSPWPKDTEVESVKTWSYLTIDVDRIKAAIATLPPSQRPQSINLPWRQLREAMRQLIALEGATVCDVHPGAESKRTPTRHSYEYCAWIQAVVEKDGAVSIRLTTATQSSTVGFCKYLPYADVDTEGRVLIFIGGIHNHACFRQPVANDYLIGSGASTSTPTPMTAHGVGGKPELEIDGIPVLHQTYVFGKNKRGTEFVLRLYTSGDTYLRRAEYMEQEAANDDDAWMLIGRCQLDTRVTDRYPSCKDGNGHAVDIDALLPSL